MIVVDTNIVHYCWVRGQNTELAQAVRRRDPDWHVPVLWRSELRNVLTAYLRRGLLSRLQIGRILSAADEALAGGLDEDAQDLVSEERPLGEQHAQQRLAEVDAPLHSR